MPISRWPQTALLHDHGDAASPIGNILFQLRLAAGIKSDPREDYARIYRERFLNVHANIIEAFSHMNKLLQTWDALYLAAWNHVAIRAKQGFRYDEVMFAPQYHCSGKLKLTPKEVVEALVAGIKQAEKGHPEIEANLLFAIGRELKPRKAIQLLRILEQCDRNYVVGANIVCDENKFPPERHRRTIEYANSAEINLEVHASEWIRRPKQAPDFWRDLPMLKKNLRFVLNLLKRFRAKKRIGHGIALPYDYKLMKIVLDEQIGITGCPGSNLQGKNTPDLRTLRIGEMLNYGILWSLNPDDDFFQPDLNEVFRMCDDEYKFTGVQRERLLTNPWLSRFGNRKPAA